MGRFTPISNTSQDLKISAAGNISEYRVPLGYMGVFGFGFWKVFFQSGDFIVPSNITKVRVRVVGGGGGARGRNFTTNVGGIGGAGGGYAHGVFDVTPNAFYSVIVGDGGTGPSTPGPGGTSSFGSLISATGGGFSMTNDTPPTPGIGIGGDFQAKGGTSILYGGGGAAGSQLGDGGSGLCAYGGGGAVGGNNAYGLGGASAFSSSFTDTGAPDATGYSYETGIEDTSVTPGSTNRDFNYMKAIIRFPFDGFTGAGGTFSLASIIGGGSGAGGGGGLNSGGFGGVGGGGGAFGSIVVPDSSVRSGFGGIGGGAGGGGDKTTSKVLTGGAAGGQGLVVVEW